MLFHPRQDNKGKPVKISVPHTPSPLPSWTDHCQMATVVPNGPMPYRLNHVLFRPWKKAPVARNGWQELSEGRDIDDPSFDAMGLKPAAGAVVVEPDGRVWLVAPTNAFGGSKVTFPKGEANGMDLRATALKEVFEEAGLRVEILTNEDEDYPYPGEEEVQESEEPIPQLVELQMVRPEDFSPDMKAALRTSIETFRNASRVAVRSPAVNRPGGYDDFRRCWRRIVEVLEPMLPIQVKLPDEYRPVTIRQPSQIKMNVVQAVYLAVS